MTEKQAWMKIGRAFEQYAATGKHTRVEVEDGVLAALSDCGMCHAFQGLGFENAYSQDRGPVGSALGPSDYELLGEFHYTRPAAYERALFCYLMAEST